MDDKDGDKKHRICQHAICRASVLRDGISMAQMLAVNMTYGIHCSRMQNQVDVREGGVFKRKYLSDPQFGLVQHTLNPHETSVC